jgi:predicted dehydrogenase
MDRRNFIMSSAAALGAAQTVFGSPADKVRMAIVGLGGRGGNHVSSFGKLPNVEIAAIVDVDDAQIAKKLKQIEQLGLPKPQVIKDLRKALDDKTIDAISIATPNHWHTLQTIWGVQAGKDVYVEKPCSHNMFESKQIVAATRKYDKIVQMGSQIRASVASQEAIKHMRDGLIGDVYMARGICFKARGDIGRKPVSAVPEGVDYDLWTGPAPKREFTANRFHYNWHWFWDTGNGDLGNQGIHEVDVARWGLGVKYPTKVSAIGGMFMFDSDQETPNTLNCAYEFNEPGQKKKMMEFEVRHWYTNPEASIKESGNNAIGNLFYGSKGYLAIDSYTSYKSWLGKEQTPGPELKKGGDHFGNFIDVVRSRKRADLYAEIEEGAISCTLVHLANISYKVGRTLHFDSKSYTVLNDPDSKSYTVLNDPEANKLFTRDYRKGFVVPEKV